MLARARSALAWLLVGLGSALLAYPGLAYANASARSAHLTTEVRRVLETAPPPVAVRRAPSRHLVVRAPREGRALGILRIPKLELRTAFLEGVSDGVLLRAPGHVPGTALPGSAGTSVLAAHRDMQFRNLGALVAGDRVAVRTSVGTTVYRVTSVRVAGGDATWITAPARGTLLRLVTCWPPSFVGPAPERLVVEAALVRHPAALAVSPQAAWRPGDAAPPLIARDVAMPVGGGPPLALPPFLGAAGTAVLALAFLGRWRFPGRARGWFGVWVVGASALNVALALALSGS